MLRAIPCLAIVLILINLNPLAASELQPTPGHLMIINDIEEQPGGECVGEVRMIYGFLPEQPVRAFSWEPDEDCGIDVRQVTAPEEVFHPVGDVTVRVDIYTNYQVTRTHRTLQTFNYGVLHCSLDPIDLEDGGVNSVQDWSHGFGSASLDACHAEAGGEWSRAITGSVMELDSDAHAFSGSTACDFSWNMPAENAAHPSGLCIPGTPDGEIDFGEQVPEDVVNVPPGEVRVVQPDDI